MAEIFKYATDLRSITHGAGSYRSELALGPRAGHWVRRLGRMEECFYEEAELTSPRCASLGGFSLHADTACEAGEGEKLERLCRYVARPALAIKRLTQRLDGLLVYKLKQAYRDGTEYLLFSPGELLEKLAALVPRPRVHLIRYHGCLAPNLSHIFFDPCNECIQNCGNVESSQEQE